MTLNEVLCGRQPDLFIYINYDKSTLCSLFENFK
jgi:hypothetical protein